MLIVKNSEQFLNVLFVGNVKRKKFKGEVIIPIDGFGVVEVDYLFDMPNHFVFCVPGNEDQKVVIRKDFPGFVLGVGNVVKSLALESIVEAPEATEIEMKKGGRKASKKEND